MGDQKEGIHVTALREIKLLRELQGQPHVIQLIDAFPVKRNIALVFEMMVSDLEAIIKDKSLVLSPGDIKAYMKMLLIGLHSCHKQWVVHRDIKPNNCLIASDGELKLADFGLARVLASPEHHRPYTNQVFALWYRAPELFFGSPCYAFAVDVWAAGCIFAELLLRRPWFPGMSDLDQLGKIFQALGTPSEENWPGVTAMPNYVEFDRVTALPLKALFPKASDDALDLLSRMASLNPSKRITAEQALAHRYFTSEPQPTPPSQLPKPVSRESNPLQLVGEPPNRPSRASGTQSTTKSEGASAEYSRGGAIPQDGGRPRKRHQTGPAMSPRIAGSASPASAVRSPRQTVNQ
eukprot:CAMPEP_0202890988 /NCGR_PEP_ID=MMETSP1392-20130828/1203_1 /ASSEMBLY_ACC=CAM_ASM_000868 /TAXON_ID=225041 /ORGANISM="Chlamydomonas chlamydogama, Strain SAG 11-48b" /LENGTH=349 /DNA_ID=CAMNT_0049574647 /DNA_START=226 /DNA_END=1275 /DNA_ORIENTATION=+